jgi:hypothetical protein
MQVYVNYYLNERWSNDAQQETVVDKSHQTCSDGRVGNLGDGVAECNGGRKFKYGSTRFQFFICDSTPVIRRTR